MPKNPDREQVLVPRSGSGASWHRENWVGPYSQRLFGTGLYGRHHIQRFAWLSRKIASLAQGNSSISILEVGCHDAKTLDFVPVKVHRYLGFDAGWEGGLETARRRFGNIKGYSFQQSVDPADVVGIREKFDFIICMETLEHIKPSKVESYLSTFADKLDGFLLVTVPNEKGLPLLCKTLGARLLGWRRTESYTVSELAKAVCGRMDRVPRVEHKGFDYASLAKSLKRYFRCVRLEGIAFAKLPVQLSLTVGIVASQKPIP